MSIVDFIKDALWCGFDVMAAILILRVVIHSIRSLRDKIGNTLKDHVRIAIYHETQSIFPYETMDFALKELMRIYLSRIRVSSSAVEISYYTYCYYVAKDLLGKKDPRSPSEERYTSYTVTSAS